METKEISAPLLGGVTGDYVKKRNDAISFFDYDVDDASFRKRMTDLQGRTYNREALTAHLFQYNERIGASEKTMEYIRTLQDSRTLVVIGGQQAGILTGPLYTLHKIISIIQLAKEQEQKLGVPVVPVFWIAGEDHDVDEINHVHVMQRGKTKKTILPHLGQKISASQTVLNQALTKSWVESVFKTFGETAHTNGLLQLVNDCLEKAETYTDFFAHLLVQLFGEEGLILVDSGAPALRQIEAPFFTSLLRRHEDIQLALKEQQECVRQKGYTPMITTKEESIHLFIDIHGERCLLEKTEEGFIAKNGELFTASELEKSIAEEPVRFSNNVVTRPLMQEYLFPTLAFIGGPGEIAYWAELQTVFHKMEFLMPPVVLRHMISYVEGHIEADLQDLSLSVEDAWKQDLYKQQEEWLSQQVEEPVEEIFSAVRSKVEDAHNEARQLTIRINRSLLPFAEKNKQKIEEQLLILERMIRKDMEQKYAVQLNKFRRVQQAICPEHGLQERFWNIFYYMNQYGTTFISDLLSLSFTWEDTHKVVKI